jgi:hypothetical protein
MDSETALDAARRTQLDMLVDTLLHALRGGDVETLMAGLTDDVEYELVGSSPSAIHGKDAVRAHHVRELANTMPERDIPLRRLYGHGFVIDELIWEGRITGRVGQLIGSGRRVSHRILRIFEVRDLLVARQTIYSDFVAITRQLA